MQGSKEDANIRGAFLHMAADAAVSVGVVLAGVAIMATGIGWIDPVVSIIIVVVIAWGTWDLFAESVGLAMDAVPRRIDINELTNALAEVPGVLEIHDLHVWGMSTSEVMLTAHLVIAESKSARFTEGSPVCAAREIRYYSHNIAVRGTRPLSQACAQRPSNKV